jgi:hypothetical protein
MSRGPGGHSTVRDESTDGEAGNGRDDDQRPRKRKLRMRPPTHTDPNAIPRNGTDVPWVELREPAHGRARDRTGDDHDLAVSEERPRRR